MPCSTCGAATHIVDQEGGTKAGRFKEKYECANGHRGTVKGEASDPPRKWSRTGPVFNESVIMHEQ